MAGHVAKHAVMLERFSDLPPLSLPRMPKAPARSARMREQRTAATRARLVAATLDATLAKGYALTMTVQIAARSGLTRGALSHHVANSDRPR